MKLHVQIECGHAKDGAAAAALVIDDTVTGVTLYEAGYVLDHISPAEAAYQGLIRALNLAASMSPEQVEITTALASLVEQVTGGGCDPLAAEVEPLFMQAQQLLLQIESWQLRKVPTEETNRARRVLDETLSTGKNVLRRPSTRPSQWKQPTLAADVEAGPGVGLNSSVEPGAEQAEAAGTGTVHLRHAGSSIDEDDDEDFELTPATKVTVLPSMPSRVWQVQLEGNPGADCPCEHLPGQLFTFTAQTPAGLCVYATRSVLNEGPLAWGERRCSSSQIACSRCGVAIRVSRKET